MRKSSWVALGICVVLAVGLAFAYTLSRSSSETLTREEALALVNTMKEAATHKDVNTIMSYVATDPETRVVNVNPDQLRLLIARAFRSAGKIRPEIAHFSFAGGPNEATMEFDLTVFNDHGDGVSQDYQGHIILKLRRLEMSHLLGLYQTREWRIVGGSSTGPDLNNFGE